MKQLLSREENEDRAPAEVVSTPKHVPVLAYILAAGATVLLLAGFVGPLNAVQQTSVFAAAAVVAILARIAQAGSQHEHLIETLKDKRRG